ncbi:MAG: tetratricopeptide repeat protein [Blastocatellia bacterium]|nr:tetratricopeptide repeat protein [Blastocatellia bacterium]
MSRTGDKIYHIADIEVDTVRGCVRRQGTELHLRHKTFQVLLYLLEQRHRLVTKEELWESLWQGTAVTDDALTRCVMDIRKALGDDSRQQRFLKTVSKAGYRFVGPVEEEWPQPALAVVETEITTYQVEVEETDLPSVSERSLSEAARARALPQAPARFRHRRMASWIALAVILILAGGYAGYRFFRPTSSPALDLDLAPAKGRKSVAVMYLDNQSNTPELDWLREGLADMLINNLSRSKKLAVLNRQQLHLVLERTGYKPGDNITLQKALEIARQIQADTIVLGSFARLDESVRIDLQLYDGRNGELLSTERLVADKQAQILSQIDLLSLKIANQLGASPETEATETVAQTVTNNLEAYRYYSLALEKAQGLDNTAAVELLKKAIALDSEFAMAYARIGYVYAIASGQVAKAKPYLEKAFQLANRLSEKDKLHLTAWSQIANLDWAGATRTMREITADYPLEVEAYLQLGRLLQGEARHEESIEVLKRGLAVDPQAKDLYNTMGLVYSEMGKHDEAIAAHRQYVALAPALPNAHDSLGLSYQWAGRYEEALDEYNRALALNPDFEVARVHLANTYYQQGRYRAAAEQFSRYIEIAPSYIERGRGYENLSLIYWRKKDYRQAAQAAEKASRYFRFPIPVQIMAAVDEGSFDTAEEMNQHWLDQQTITNRGRRLNPKLYYFSRGYIALKRGQTDTAIESFKETARQPPLIWTADTKEDCLANAYLELGRLDEAVAEYERILRLNPNYPLVHFHLAEVYERRGQRERAMAEYKEFLRIWSDADRDIPEIILTRERLNLPR